MEVAEKTEIGAEGLEGVIESGLDSVRVRREKGLSVRSRMDLSEFCFLSPSKYAHKRPVR